MYQINKNKKWHLGRAFKKKSILFSTSYLKKSNAASNALLKILK
jgi:hypothetical protein